MTNIDVHFDFRNDSQCGDPDTDSIKLYQTHQLLWSKNFPDQRQLIAQAFSKGGKYGRMLLKNNLYDHLSSDRMCPHFVGSYKGKFDGWHTHKENEEFKYIVRTIGGHIVFPAHKKNGMTINQARGINKKICDRFDLTLEYVRQFYLNEPSPLAAVIHRYADFFALFGSFKDYIDFFLFQDFVHEDH